MRLLPALIFLISACASLKQDTAPAPVDPGINQARLEFAGCGKASQVGMLVCFPGQTASIVTEFPGDVIYFSSGTNPGVDCSIKQQVRATPPVTALSLPFSQTSDCAVTVYYLPEYPGASDSIYPIFGFFGQVDLQPDTTYPVDGYFALTTAQMVQLSITGATRGEYEMRNMNAPLPFVGNSFTYRPVVTGIDLIQAKYWDQNNNPQHILWMGNYYSSMALQLTFDQDERDLTYPEQVSIITVAGDVTRDSKVTLPKNFTGYVRAYTVQGRTLVSYFESGVLQWSQ